MDLLSGLLCHCFRDAEVDAPLWPDMIASLEQCLCGLERALELPAKALFEVGSA